MAFKMRMPRRHPKTVTMDMALRLMRTLDIGFDLPRLRVAEIEGQLSALLELCQRMDWLETKGRIARYMVSRQRRKPDDRLALSLTHVDERPHAGDINIPKEGENVPVEKER